MMPGVCTYSAVQICGATSLQLGLPRAEHQNFLCSSERQCNGVIVLGVLGLATRTQGSSAGVQFVLMLGRVNHEFFYIVGADVHHVGFRVIEPDNSVIVRHTDP